MLQFRQQKQRVTVKGSFRGQPGPVESHVGLGTVLNIACSMSYLRKQKRNRVSRPAGLDGSNALIISSETLKEEQETPSPPGSTGGFPRHATARQHPLGGAADEAHSLGFAPLTRSGPDTVTPSSRVLTLVFAELGDVV